MRNKPNKKQIGRAFKILDEVRQAARTDANAVKVRGIDLNINADIDEYIYGANTMDTLLKYINNPPQTVEDKQEEEIVVNNWYTSVTGVFQDLNEDKAKSRMNTLLRAPEDLIRTDIWRAAYKVYLSAGTMTFINSVDVKAQRSEERKNFLNAVRTYDQKAAKLLKQLKETYGKTDYFKLEEKIQANRRTISNCQLKLEQLKKASVSENLAILKDARSEMLKRKELNSNEIYTLKNALEQIDEFEKFQSKNTAATKEDLAEEREDYARTARNAIFGILDKPKGEHLEDLHSIKLYAQAMLDYTEKTLDGKIEKLDGLSKDPATKKKDKQLNQYIIETTNELNMVQSQQNWLERVEKNTVNERKKLADYVQYRNTQIQAELGKEADYYNPENDIMKQADVILGKKDALKGMHINSSEYNRMVEALHVVSTWNSVETQNALSGKKDAPTTLGEALARLETAADAYLKAKDGQKRPKNASALRASRYAFAESILDFAKTGKEGIDLARETENEYNAMAQELKQKFDIEKVKTEPEKKEISNIDEKDHMDDIDAYIM